MEYIFRFLAIVVIIIHAVIGIKHGFRHFKMSVINRKDKEDFHHHISLFFVYLGGLVIDGCIIMYFLP